MYQKTLAERDSDRTNPVLRSRPGSEIQFLPVCATLVWRSCSNMESKSDGALNTTAILVVSNRSTCTLRVVTCHVSNVHDSHTFSIRHIVYMIGLATFPNLVQGALVWGSSSIHKSSTHLSPITLLSMRLVLVGAARAMGGIAFPACQFEILMATRADATTLT